MSCSIIHRSRIGNYQIGSAIAMMVMPASGQAPGLIVAVRRVFMMFGVLVMVIMHGIEREIFRTAMIMRYH